MNHTTVVEFVLLGLANSRRWEITLFVFLGTAYLLILLGNISVIGITLTNNFLQTPMYYFLRNFALLEITFTSTFLPSTLYSLLTERKTISLPGCFLQMLFFYCLGTCTLFYMAVMSLDRYVAICHPLHYPAIMNSRFCLQLILGCWALTCLLMFPPTIMTVQLPFCGPNVMNHFYCDASLLLQLSCTDTGFIEQLMFIILILILPATALVIFTPFCLILLSYTCIISSILRISSAESRHKTFSTCSSHLTVVTLYCASGTLIYLQPKSSNSQEAKKVLALIYTTVIPTLNPLIYSLRNKEVKEVLIRGIAVLMKK
ncbi:unnamed protein product [Coccothraustes coccothraustes]